MCRAPWVAPSVKHPTLGFSSSRDLAVCEMDPHVGFCAENVEPAWHSLYSSLSAPHLLTLSVSQINKLEEEEEEEEEEEGGGGRGGGGMCRVNKILHLGHSFMHLFSMHLPSTYYVLSTGLGIGVAEIPAFKLFTVSGRDREQYMIRHLAIHSINEC